jgi:hypothetical protein
MRNVGNSEAEKLPLDDQDEFDPWLGLLLGDTWWKIGKNFAGILNVDGEKRTQNLELWVGALRAELSDEEMHESVDGMTAEALMQFIETVMDVLERKFDGKKIGADVRRLTQKSNRYNIYDEGQYLDFQEPTDTFWAAEYNFLFSDLDKTHSGGGWLNAVGRCADPDCNIFFIKSRSDQRHHTPACRTRSANRQSYSEKSGQKAHTKRGRPRVVR